MEDELAANAAQWRTSQMEEVQTCKKITEGVSEGADAISRLAIFPYLLTFLEGEDDLSTGRMIEALRRLPEQPQPSEAVVPGLLDGLPKVNRLVDNWLDPPVVQRIDARHA